MDYGSEKKKVEEEIIEHYVTESRRTLPSSSGSRGGSLKEILSETTERIISEEIPVHQYKTITEKARRTYPSPVRNGIDRRFASFANRFTRPYCWLRKGILIKLSAHQFQSEMKKQVCARIHQCKEEFMNVKTCGIQI